MVCQNLVVNGDFEEYIQCRGGDGISPYFNGYVRDWNSYLAQNGFDLGAQFHIDCFQGDEYWWNLQIDSMEYYSGESLIVCPWTRRNPTSNVKRFYYYSRLQEVMIKDSTYSVSYVMHMNKNYSISDHVGVTFITDTSQIYASGDQYLTNDYVGYRDEFKGPDDIWHEIEGCYIAKGGEQWVLVGTFLPHNEIHFSDHTGTFADFASMLLFDDLKVSLATSIRESDEEMIVCDGDEVDLPLPENDKVIIVDEFGIEVTDFFAEWPYLDTLYYEDACFGRLGMISIIPEICDELIEEDIVLCVNQNIDLQTYTSEEYYLLDEAQNVVTNFTSEVEGLFTLYVVHDRYGQRGEIVIEVVACNDCEIFLPNIINLNSPINNLFTATTNCSFLEFEIAIYDRWGGKIFTSTDPSFQWEGDGNKLTTGVYAYVVKYQFIHPTIPQSLQYYTGDITLIK